MAVFTGFELRLRAAFPDDFGQRFESVAKWFLETDPRFTSQLERVWLWDEWPGRWASRRRMEFGKGRLSAERIAALEAIPGWEW